MLRPTGGASFYARQMRKCRKGSSVLPATLWTLGLEVQSPAEWRVPRGRVFLCPSNKKMPEGEIRYPGNSVDARAGGAESR
ncbi:hypothetical protein NDU88_005719 [Pleurodeles waltl]|uniref:Uncharacterized protein n=1 Tax=Pleurodeles waltl TaxID=8319 RepID=A0AAV7TCE8_PLEWA|nr:hypothetical protein NDU88_005719 [Pleurodeles waltl]